MDAFNRMCYASTFEARLVGANTTKRCKDLDCVIEMMGTSASATTIDFVDFLEKDLKLQYLKSNEFAYTHYNHTMRDALEAYSDGKRVPSEFMCEPLFVVGIEKKKLWLHLERRGWSAVEVTLRDRRDKPIVLEWVHDAMIMKRYNVHRPSLVVVQQGICMLVTVPGKDYLRQTAQLNLLPYVLGECKGHGCSSTRWDEIYLRKCDRLSIWLDQSALNVGSFITWTGLNELQAKIKDSVVVLGYVVELASYLEAETAGRWKWDVGTLNDPEDNALFGYGVLNCSDTMSVLFLGWTETYWGDFSGTLADALYHLGATEIIYAAKLATMTEAGDVYDKLFVPSKYILIDKGGRLVWNSTEQASLLLEEIAVLSDGIQSVHASIPTVLDETSATLSNALRDHSIGSLDDEIAYMAWAAERHAKRFVSIHFATDYINRMHEKKAATSANLIFIEARRKNIMLRKIGYAILQYFVSVCRKFLVCVLFSLQRSRAHRTARNMQTKPDLNSSFTPRNRAKPKPSTDSWFRTLQLKTQSKMCQAWTRLIGFFLAVWLAVWSSVWARKYWAFQVVKARLRDLYKSDRFWALNGTSFVELELQVQQLNDEERRSPDGKDMVGRRDILVGRRVSLEDMEPSKRMLIEGKAGAGKTVLLKHMAYDWAARGKKKLHDRFAIVIFVKLESDMKTLTDVVRGACCTVKSNFMIDAFVDWCEINAHCVLWLIDGWNEIVLRNGVIKDIRNGVHGTGVENMIACSRPGQVMKSLNMKLAVHGFSTQGVDAFIDKFFAMRETQNIQAVRAALQNTWLKDACRLPLMLQFICMVPPSRSTELKRMTDIYRLVVVEMLKRSAELLQVSEEEKEAEVVRMRAHLQSLAWTCFRDNTCLVLNDTMSMPDSWRSSLYSGLLTKETGGVDGSSMDRRYTWSHNTIQEYLAAEYLCNNDKPVLDVTQVILCWWCASLIFYKELRDILRRPWPKRNVFFGFVCALGGSAKACRKDWYPCTFDIRPLGGLKDVGPVTWIEEGGKDLEDFLRGFKGDDVKKKMVLGTAAQEGYWHKAVKEKFGRAMLETAAQEGCFGAVKFLLDWGVPAYFELEESSSTPLHRACESGNVDIVKQLCDKLKGDQGVKELDEAGNSPMDVACAQGHINIVEHFVGFYPEVLYEVDSLDERVNTPLLRACQSGHLTVAKFLLNKIPDLLLAKADRDDPLVQCLLDAACSSRDIPTVEWLIGLVGSAKLLLECPELNRHGKLERLSLNPADKETVQWVVGKISNDNNAIGAFANFCNDQTFTNAFHRGDGDILLCVFNFEFRHSSSERKLQLLAEANAFMCNANKDLVSKLKNHLSSIASDAFPAANPITTDDANGATITSEHSQI